MYVQCEAKLFISIVTWKKFFMAKVFLCYTFCNNRIFNPHMCSSSVIFFLYVPKHMNGYYSFDMLLFLKIMLGDSRCVVQLWKRSYT
jgi:hypothetical protein